MEGVDHVVVEHAYASTCSEDSIGNPATSECCRPSSRHDLVVTDDVAGAAHVYAGVGIQIGANIFNDMALGNALVHQMDPPSKPTDRAVLDRDVLTIVRIDPDSIRGGASGQTTKFEAVEVQYDVVRRDLDRGAMCLRGVQVAGEAVDALHGDDDGY